MLHHLCQTAGIRCVAAASLLIASHDAIREFSKKYDGLIARNKKLGCDHCAKCDSMNIKGIRVSPEWANCSFEASGKTTTIMQASLRKNMKQHFSSKAHRLCVKKEEYHACDAITKSIDKMNERYIASTFQYSLHFGKKMQAIF